MAVKLSKNNLCINKIITRKTEKIIVEGDAIVPDIKPDILSIVSCSGNVCINKKEIQSEKIKLEGTVNSYVIYIADDEKSNIRTINANLDFSKSLDVKDVNENMIVDCSSKILKMDCKVLNGRKVNLKAVIEVSLIIYSNENIEYIDNIEDENDIELLNEQISINTLIGTGTTKAYAKDTISIENTDNLSEIMKVSFEITNKESKISYNKILAKADAVFNIMYLTDDGRINTVNAVIPIVGFIDMQNVTEEDICELSYEVRNIQVKANNVEDHSIYVEAELEILGFVYKKQDINIIQDLYGRNRNLEYEQKNVRAMIEKQCISENCNIRKKEKMEEIEQNKILNVEVVPILSNTMLENGSVTYTGELNFTFVYSKENSSQIEVKTLIEPFEFTISSNELTPNTTIQTNIDVSKKDFIIMPDGNVEIKVDLKFDLEIIKEENIKIIESIKESDQEPKQTFSIVIYYTKEGDTLWKIAKKFGSTVEEIIRINNIENADKIMIGEQLFIPR